MTLTQLLRDIRFRPALITAVVFACIFFVLNIFVVGGDAFYSLSNDVIPAVLAALASFQVYLIWLRSEGDQHARQVWSFLLAGMIVWTIGDLIWSYYDIVLHIDVPYPSWADAMWVCGYFFFFFGLYAQLRTYNIEPKRRDWQNIAVVETVFLLLAILFVFIPILQSFDNSRPLASLLDVSYPALDMILFPMAFLILTTLGDGRLAVAWKIITVGFMIRALSDVYFSYITQQGIYMPNGSVNLLTSMYDFIYASSYLVLVLGLVAFRQLTSETPTDPAPVEQPIPTTWNYILVSTDRANRIISYSDNFLTLLGRTGEMPGIKGALLYGLLGLEENSLTAFVTELAERGFVEAMQVRVKDGEGNETEARLSALAVRDVLNNFSGVNMVISTLAPVGSEAQLSPESQGVIRDILSKTGNLQKETRASLSLYFNTQMRMLDNLVHQYGGKTISQTMRMVINTTAIKSGWEVRKEGLDFVFPDQPDLATLAACMSTVLAAAKSYAVDMVGLQLVNSQVQSINMQTHPDVLRAVESYKMRLDGS